MLNKKENIMSMMKSIVDQTPDPVVVPAGEQYQLSILKGEFRSSKSGFDEKTGKEKKPRPMLVLYMKILDHANAKMVSSYSIFPITEETRKEIPGIPKDIENDTEENAYNWMLELKDICLSFGLNLDEIPYKQYQVDMEAIPLPTFAGKTAWEILGVEQDNQGRPVNIVKTWKRQS